MEEIKQNEFKRNLSKEIVKEWQRVLFEEGGIRQNQDDTKNNIYAMMRVIENFIARGEEAAFPSTFLLRYKEIPPGTYRDPRNGKMVERTTSKYHPKIELKGRMYEATVADMRKTLDKEGLNWRGKNWGGDD
jgi:hypothetical protein